MSSERSTDSSRAELRSAVLARAMPPRRKRASGIAFGALADACAVGLLALSMWLIARAGEQPPILHLTFAIVGVRALAIGRAALRYTERLAGHNAALAQLAELRAGTFEALVPRVPGAIESHRRGDVLAAFVDDVDQLQDQPLRVRGPLVTSGVVVGLSILVLALVSPLAALILAVSLLLAGGLSIQLSARIAGTSDRALSAARAALTDVLLERFGAAEVLVAYDAIGVQRERIRAAEEHLARVQLRRTRAVGLTGAILALASGTASVWILLAVSPWLGTSLSAPLFAAAVIVPAAVFEVFAQVPAAWVARRVVAASADRVAAMTETPIPPEIPVERPADARHGDEGEKCSEPVLAGSVPLGLVTSGPVTPGSAVSERRNAPGAPATAPLVAVQNLRVRHPGAEAPAVSGVSFELMAGQTLVVTGESGAGKSTLALALVRFLDYRGSYRLGGFEARTLDPSRVRAVVGLCEQAPHLFDTDLRQNLKFARDTASDDELMAVLARVGLRDWAEERGGLDARVGERGVLVSGGQAQRIALARAILADFPVIVLDEPTAGVDRERADRLLTELLGAVPSNRAVILITHTELPEGIGASRLEL